VSFFPPPVCFFHGEKIKKKVSNHFPFSLFLLAPADDVVVVGKVKIENRKLAARLLLYYCRKWRYSRAPRSPCAHV
jgi:hypothetical protein